MATDLNWDELRSALRLEMIDGEPAGSDAARRALELILGEETLRQSVDYYVALRPAREIGPLRLMAAEPRGRILE